MNQNDGCARASLLMNLLRTLEICTYTGAKNRLHVFNARAPDRRKQDRRQVGYVNYVVSYERLSVVNLWLFSGHGALASYSW